MGAPCKKQGENDKRQQAHKLNPNLRLLKHLLPCEKFLDGLLIECCCPRGQVLWEASVISGRGVALVNEKDNSAVCLCAYAPAGRLEGLGERGKDIAVIPTPAKHLIIVADKLAGVKVRLAKGQAYNHN